MFRKLICMLLCCLLALPGAALAERSPLCENVPVVEGACPGEYVKVTLQGAEHDAAQGTYTLRWYVECMLEDPASVSPRFDTWEIVAESLLGEQPYVFLWNCGVYAGDERISWLQEQIPFVLTDIVEFADPESEKGYLCSVVVSDKLPEGAPEWIEVHFAVMRDTGTNPGNCEYTVEQAVDKGWEEILESFLLRFHLVQ